MHRFQPLTPELIAAQAQMKQHAENYGLDCFPVIFEVVDYDQLNAVAAYGGFPTRYPHWRFGMEYEQLSKSYSYGLSKIYELVINNDPCYAYLMQSNSLTDQKLVMAHVYGHCDFFKNNYWFSRTSRKMMDEMANHGNRVRRYMERFGVEKVEAFIDACLSVEDLIDIHSPFIKRQDDNGSRYRFSAADEEPESPRPGKFQAKDYMDDFINPPGRLAAEAESMRLRQEEQLRDTSLPTRDVLLYILENGPLRPWQADVLSIIRDEAYYFAPQGQTKIMNEGWATYWHSTIMTRHGLEPNDVVDYADHTAGTLATHGNRLNPYKLGVELFRDIEDRWNRGRFGREYEDCHNIEDRRNWDTHAGQGRQKIFEVRRIHNDVTFLDSFLTEDFCREHKLFSFSYNEQTDYYEIDSREFDRVKQQLLGSLTNLGRPIIELIDGNYKNRAELYLLHQFQGVEIHRGYARDTLANLHTLWGRPVHIETVFEDAPTVLSFDGIEHKITKGKARNKICER